MPPQKGRHTECSSRFVATQIYINTLQENMNAEKIHFCQSVVFLKGMKFMSQNDFSTNQGLTQAFYTN